MSKMDFKLNSNGVADLLKSKGMQDVLKGYAAGIKNKSGAGYEQDMHVGKNRANARVWAETSQAKSDNLKNNTILKSVK
ncbi:hypothetical protein CWR48_04295 [Oceanobacillus arenosus]|uniref:Phage protein n=1 Tax=Oceanobacillus arenosus TaxID=1229153 RepID=A0A3D8Q0U3_9BACI|nr:hypothetical protein [Oceanobacillus arenosus]RDW21039.1 hypothetical protein CWR48_04295 [Oceanobacillus arenosus]